jgi:hypothetical protein
MKMHCNIKINAKFAPAKQRPTTHIIRGVLIGAGINQQPQTRRVIIFSGTNQRSVSVLQIGFAAAQTAMGHFKPKKTVYSAIYDSKEMWRTVITTAKRKVKERKHGDEHVVLSLEMIKYLT